MIELKAPEGLVEAIEETRKQEEEKRKSENWFVELASKYTKMDCEDIFHGDAVASMDYIVKRDISLTLAAIYDEMRKRK